jgi:hypothetical protein
MGTNRTRYKSLDRMAKDPRIREIWEEGKDGLWVSLSPGYSAEGTSGLHEYTVRDLLKARERIEKGEPY